MHKRLLETTGVALLLGGCTERPATGSDAAIAPEDCTAKPIDPDVLVAEDVVADVVTPFDRVDAGDVVDAPTADADLAPAVADVGVDVGGPRRPAGQSLCGDACATACPAGRVCAVGACSGEQRSCPATGGRGCGLVEITGGTFAMGDTTLPDYVYASPVQPMITVSDFAVDAKAASRDLPGTASGRGTARRGRPVDSGGAVPARGPRWFSDSPGHHCHPCP